MDDMFVKLENCEEGSQNIVGNKAINLSLLMQIRDKYNFEVPDGIVLKSDFCGNIIDNAAHEYYSTYIPNRNLFLSIRKNDRDDQVKDLISREIKDHIKKNIKEGTAKLLVDVSTLLDFLKKLSKILNCEYFYIRSSTNIGDKEDKSYAGIFESVPIVVNKITEEELFENLSELIEGLFSREAIIQYFRYMENIYMLRFALIFQKVEGKTAVLSGVVQTKLFKTPLQFKENIKKSKNMMYITGGQGLGAGIMPIEYIPVQERESKTKKRYSFEGVLYNDEGFNYDVRDECKKQEEISVIDTERGWGIKSEPISAGDHKSFDREILEALFKICKNIDNGFIEKYEHKPLLIEFAIFKDASTKELKIQIVQLRPQP